MTDPFAPPSGDQPAQPTQAFTPPPPVYGAPPAVPVYGTPQAPPPYGAPPQPYGAPLVGPQKNGLGVAALVLGILAILSCLSVIGGVGLGILALIFGLVGRGRVKRREANNGGVALAGAICGGLGLLGGIGALILWISFFNSDAGQRYLDCTDAARGDSVATQKCTDQLRHDILGN